VLSQLDEPAVLGVIARLENTLRAEKPEYKAAEVGTHSPRLDALTMHAYTYLHTCTLCILCILCIFVLSWQCRVSCSCMYADQLTEVCWLDSPRLLTH
jgi:hypothetical protein